MANKKTVKETIKQDAKKIEDKLDKEVQEVLEKKYLFKIKTNNDFVRLRKEPSIKEAPTNIAGRMFPGRTYYVVQEILFTPIKMYKLDNGYYVIADQKITKVD